MWVQKNNVNEAYDTLIMHKRRGKKTSVTISKGSGSTPRGRMRFAHISAVIIVYRYMLDSSFLV